MNENSAAALHSSVSASSTSMGFPHPYRGAWRSAFLAVRTFLSKVWKKGARASLVLLAMAISGSVLVLHLTKVVVSDAVAVQLLTLALLPVLLPALSTFVESFSVLGGTFSFRRKVDALESRVEVLLEAAEHTLTKYEEGHLHALLDPGWIWHGSYFLQGEFIRLCQHDFVEEVHPRGDGPRVWDIPGDGRVFDMKPICRITDKGRRHLEIVQSLRREVSG